MKSKLVPIIFAFALLGTLSTAPAALIHESATLGPTGQTGGVSLFSNQFLGSRFSVASPVQVEAIGGHLFGTGTYFGAIVSLTSSGALPSGSPFDLTTLASTVFTPPSPSEDFLTPLSVALPAGDYALIFGSGEFGSSGGGGMPTNNTDIPGQASYFFWNGNNWQSGGFSSTRFVVSDTFASAVVPEPSTLALLGLGISCIAGCGYRRRRTA